MIAELPSFNEHLAKPCDLYPTELPGKIVASANTSPPRSGNGAALAAKPTFPVPRLEVVTFKRFLGLKPQSTQVSKNAFGQPLETLQDAFDPFPGHRNDLGTVSLNTAIAWTEVLSAISSAQPLPTMCSLGKPCCTPVLTSKCGLTQRISEILAPHSQKPAWIRLVVFNCCSSLSLA